MIGRSESILAMCQALHYDLVALHVQIQLLAANWKLGKTEQALELLRRSLSQLFQMESLCHLWRIIHT